MEKTENIARPMEAERSDMPLLVTQAEEIARACQDVTDRLLDEPADCEAAVQRLLEDWRNNGGGLEGATAAMSLAEFMEESPLHRQTLMEALTPLNARNRDRFASELRRLWRDTAEVVGTAAKSRHNSAAWHQAASEPKKGMTPAESLYCPVPAAARGYGSELAFLGAKMAEGAATILSEALAASATAEALGAFWRSIDEETTTELRRHYKAFAERWKEEGIPDPDFLCVPCSESLWPCLFLRHYVCCRDSKRLRNAADELDAGADKRLAASRALVTTEQALREQTAPEETRRMQQEVYALGKRLDDLAARLAVLEVENALS